MFDDWILNRVYSRPEAAYYWGYFVFMNSFWIVIPLFLLWKAVRAIQRAFVALEKMDRTLKGGKANGTVKKSQ